MAARSAQMAPRALPLALLAFLASAADPVCESAAWTRWLTELQSQCNPPADVMTEYTEEACSWIDCDCLEVTLQVPVELDTIAECWEQTMQSTGFSEVQLRMLEEMLRGSACGTRTERLGGPCGDCDRFFDEHQCEPYTIPKRVIFHSQASGLRASAALSGLGAVLAAALRWG
mmetsp:Transcript_69659/g.204393  ORF Transcript_69659/g.204393 Transcript_69659/m.204393 type:complete len:173 (+) Transcript_69659:42-560(+)